MFDQLRSQGNFNYAAFLTTFLVTLSTLVGLSALLMKMSESVMWSEIAGCAVFSTTITLMLKKFFLSDIDI